MLKQDLEGACHIHSSTISFDKYLYHSSTKFCEVEIHLVHSSTISFEVEIHEC